MKEKNKKIIKTLGVGAVATLGLFTMVGCSLSDSEKADLMKGLENANTYMEETIDLLEEQNKELKDQNNNLESYLEALQQENAKITTEEAYNKLMIAKVKLETNNKGIGNNLRVICVATDGKIVQNQIVELYKTENNGYISNLIFDDYRGFSSNLCYEDDDVVYEYIKELDAEGNFVKYTKNVRTDFVSSESGGGLTYAMESLFLDDLSEESIYSVEILENSNYKISAIIESEIKQEDENFYYNKQTFFLEYELTYDHKFVSMNISQYVKTEEVGNGSAETKISTVSGSLFFEYGVVTENYINALLDEAKAAELTTNQEE